MFLVMAPPASKMTGRRSNDPIEPMDLANIAKRLSQVDHIFSEVWLVS
jgi:hypothetical protein